MSDQDADLRPLIHEDADANGHGCPRDVHGQQDPYAEQDAHAYAATDLPPTSALYADAVPDADAVSVFVASPTVPPGPTPVVTPGGCRPGEVYIDGVLYRPVS